jgi:transketolase
MPIDDLPAKWNSFGWEVHEIDGHSEEEMKNCFEKLRFEKTGTPKVIIAHTIKGKGVSFTEGHGAWHHRVPSDIEMNQLINELA